MERIPVTSSNIASVGYDTNSATLEVEFNNGRIYQYFSVPISQYDGLMNASSKGKYFYKNIQNQYKYTEI